MAKNKKIECEDKFSITYRSQTDFGANYSITLKVMLFFCSMLSDNYLNDNSINIPFTEVKTALKINDKRYLENSLKYISSIRYKYYTFHKDDKENLIRDSHNVSIIKSYNFDYKRFTITFSNEFLDLMNMRNYYDSKTKTKAKIAFLEIPNELLEANVKKYRNTIFLGIKILLDKKINQNNPKRKDVISIKELIKYTPLIPKYEELNKEQRQISKRIIMPFENELNNVCSTLGLKWHYIAPFANEEHKKYDEFFNNKILFEVDS